MRKFAHVFSSTVSGLTFLFILAAAVFFVPRAWGGVRTLCFLVPWS